MAVGGAVPERDISRDLARRALWLAPPFVLLGALGWGADGVASVGLAVALVAMAAAREKLAARSIQDCGGGATGAGGSKTDATSAPSGSESDG